MQTVQEIFEKITADDKWYANIRVGDGYMSPQYAYKIKKNFNTGKLEESTLVWLFDHFGYRIERGVYKKMA